VPSNSAEAGIMVTAYIRATTVVSNTLSIMPVVTVTVRSVSTIKPSNSYSTTWTNSCRGRTSCSPLPCLSPFAPSSLHINVPRTTPCFTPRPRPSNGLPKTHALSGPTCQALPAFSIRLVLRRNLGPATPVSSAYPLHRSWRRPLQGPHHMVSLSRQLLCPRQSALPHLPCPLQRRDAPRRSPRAD
jgi:hypothetical protein